MPSDAELERALRTRDCYAFKRGFYLLTTLENSWHAKDPLDFSGVMSGPGRPSRGIADTEDILTLFVHMAEVPLPAVAELQHGIVDSGACEGGGIVTVQKSINQRLFSERGFPDI